MATKLFDLYLEKISYEGDNIGSNLTVTLKPGSYPVTSFKPQVCEAGMQKPLVFGKSTNGTSRLLVRDLSSAGAVTIPMAVTVEEKDVVSDQGTDTKNLVINLNGPRVQPFDMQVTVEGKGGTKDKGKTAKFGFRFAAALDGGPRLFRLGADNIGFENLGGAVKLPDMAGNCYTMAVVAKLFYQAAEFRATVGPGETKGFDPKDVARALRAPDFPATKFPVRGYQTLFAMSDARGLNDPEDWMDKTSRFATGLSPVGPKQPGPANADALVSLYQMITSIHYLHYLQNQAAPLIRSAVARLKGGQDAVERIAADTIAELKRGLANGDLGLLCMFNPDPQVLFGHVVLAYKIVDDPGAPYVDIYVYDNNTVYTAGTDETVLRVERASGHFDYMDKPECQGAALRQPKQDPVDPKKDRNPGFSWWDRNGQVLILLPDSNLEPANRVALAAKLENGIEATAYIQATGDLIKDVTQNAPTTSTLFDDVKKFILACQRTNKKLKTTPPWRKYDLPDNATVADMNRYLADYTELTIKELLPFVLPKGLLLSNTKLRFGGALRNTAFVETTITISPETPIKQLVAAVRESALLAQDPKLADVVENFATVFGKEKVTLHLRLSLKKTVTPPALAAKVGPFIPIPNLDGSHCIVGDTVAGVYDPKTGDHRIELSERILDGAYQSVLKGLGAFTVQNFAYMLPLTGNHTANVTLTKSDFDCQEARLALLNRFEGFVGLTKVPVPVLIAGKIVLVLEERGVNFEGNPTVGLFLKVAKTKGKGAAKNVFTVRAAANGWIRAKDGLGGLGVDLFVLGLNTLLAGKILPILSATASGVVAAQLAPFVAFANGTSFSFGAPTLTSGAGRIAVVIPVSPFDVDLGATIKTLFGKRAPMEVKDVQFETDRIVIITSNDP